MSELLLRGILLGMADMGATHIKTTEDKIYFEIKKDSVLGDSELKRAASLLKEYGLKLMIKRL